MELKKLWKFNVSLLRIFGMWFSDDKYLKYYIVYSVILHTSLTVMYMGPMWIEMFLLDDVEKIVQLFYISLTEMVLFNKYLTLIFKNNRIRRVVAIAGNAEYEPKSKDEDILAEDNKMLVNIILFFYNSVMICLLTSVFGNLFLSGYRLPFFSWYFNLDWQKTTRRYWIFYIYQSIGMSMHAITNTAFDCLYPYLLNFARGQFCLLEHRLSNLSSNELLYKKQLLENIKFHQWIISYCRELESIFSEVMFLQFNISGFVLCFTAYQITVISPSENLPAFFFFIAYAAAMILQCGLSCFYGNEVTLKSIDLGNGLFYSNWYKLAKRPNAELKFFLMKSNRPTRLMVGNFFYLNLGTLTSILNSAYSLYAVLKSGNLD